MALPPLKFEIAWGSNSWAAPAWTDETAGLRRTKSSSGRQHELQQFNTAVSETVLKSNDRAYDPTWAGGPHAGQLVPGVRHRLRAFVGGTWVPVFHHWAQRWQPQRPMQASGQTTLTGNDVFNALRRKRFSDSTWPGVLNGIFGPRAYYRLGDVPGSSTAKDQSANHYDGSIVPFGSTTPAFGAPGALVTDLDTALSLPKPDTSSASIGYLSLPAAVGGMGAGELTVGFWAKIPRGGSSPRLDWRHPFGYTPYSQWIMQPIDGEGVFYGDATNVFLAPSHVFGTVDDMDGNWHLFVWTRDTDGVTNHFYVDDELRGTSVASFHVDFNAVGAQPLLVTAGWVGANASDSVMDELFFMNHAVTLSDVQALYREGVGKWAGQSPGQRIGVVLDVIGYPSGDRNIAAGLATLQAATSLGGQPVLNHLQAVELTEGGMFFQGPDEKITFYDRHRPLTSPGNVSVATFGDNPAAGEIPYEQAPDTWVDDVDVHAEAISTRDNGSPQRAIDTAAEGQFGPGTINTSGLQYDSDNQSLDLSNWLVTLYKAPQVRIGAVKVHAGVLDPSLWPTLLALKIGDRITVKGRPVPKTTPAFSYDQIVEGVAPEFDLDKQDWWITFQLSPAVNIGFWIMDVSALDSTTRFAF